MIPSDCDQIWSILLSSYVRDSLLVVTNHLSKQSKQQPNVSSAWRITLTAISQHPSLRTSNERDIYHYQLSSSYHEPRSSYGDHYSPQTTSLVQSDTSARTGTSRRDTLVVYSYQ